jgi:hypothetical protein
VAWFNEKPDYTERALSWFNRVRDIIAEKDFQDPNDFPPDALIDALTISENIAPGQMPPDDITMPLMHLAKSLYLDAGYFVGAVAAPPRITNKVEQARYFEEIEAHVSKYSDDDGYAYARKLILSVLIYCIDNLPQFVLQPREDGFGPRAHLYDLLPDARSFIAGLPESFTSDECYRYRLFPDFRAKLLSNFEAAAEQKLSQSSDQGALTRAYLAGTPLLDFLSIKVPIGFPTERRFEHTVIVAGTGHGKTQTLEALVCEDLRQIRPPGLVVIDSKGDMVKRLAKLDLFNPDDGPLRDKLIVIDPREGPSLSPFDVGLRHIQDADSDSVEEVVNGIISELGYFFKALLGAEISGPMSGVFNPLIQLLVRIPGANLETLAQAVDDPTVLIEKAHGLPEIIKTFLTTQYKELSAKETRNAVKRRVYMLMTSSPSFARMFNAPCNNLDLAAALNEGKIVLVSTEANFLHDFSPLFGRYIISQAMCAARRRAAIPEGERQPAFIVVDEAGEYFDDRTETMLRTLRSYKVGGVLAFQDFGKLAPGLHSAISSSTSIRLAGGKIDDLKYAGHLVHAEPEFVRQMRKVDRTFSDFACYIDGVTPNGIALRVPHGTVDSLPPMSDEQYARMRAANKARLVAKPESKDRTEIVRPRHVEQQQPKEEQIGQAAVVDKDDQSAW